MGLKLLDERLNGLMLFEPAFFEDDRGFFMESYKAEDLLDYGINEPFVQDNHSGSRKGVVRGMHFQWDSPQGKLIRVTRGEALVVEVDLRKNSPTLGEHAQFNLSESNRQMLWIPAGFANGFAALSDWVEVQYKCTAHWNKTGEGAIRWNDPKLNINWGIENQIISPKDNEAQTLEEWLAKPESDIFRIKP